MEILARESFKTVTRPKNLSFQIEEQLVDAINKGVFTVGDYLPSENQLVEIFGVSRGVIREALLMLAAKNIVEIQEGKGTLILSPSVDSLFESFSSLVNFKCGNMGLQCTQEVRMMLEPHIALLSAIHRTESDIEKLREYIEKMELEKNNKDQLSYYDIKFHKTIARACGNPMFSLILEPIFHFLGKYHKNTFEDLTSNQITLEFHNRILTAIIKQDSNKALHEMKQHLLIAHKDIEKLYK